MTLSARLADLRNRAGLTQRKLSELSGVNPQTISEIERGIGNPTLATLEALAHALEVNISELLTEAKPEPAEAAS